MHTSAFLSSLLVSLLPAATAQWCKGQPNKPGYCTPQTWTNLTTADSPKTGECEDACRGVASDAGDWGANLTGVAAGQRRSVVGYACGFSLGRGPNQPDPLEFDFQNQDILDIYQGAIDRFATADGRVAATGTMVCQGKSLQWWVD
ncbi:chitinase [Apiospora kogelbergensis]|uniref:chitinase n=1 Tax=Apiospora kogelbergensis TaxID=1337665 RepID=UPI00312D5BFA